VDARASAAQEKRGAEAFPLVWTGISEPNLRRIAGSPTWAGASGLCSGRVNDRFVLADCGSGDRCLMYGDVETASATEFCFRGGLSLKRRWREPEWQALVDARS
jgi:hypothetical protein